MKYSIYVCMCVFMHSTVYIYTVYTCFHMCHLWLFLSPNIYDSFVTISMCMWYSDAAFVLFDGWTVNTVAIALIQAFGGLLVAATLKYADAVLKTLATSGSIVISAVLGYLFLGGTLDLFVSLGALTTILAITNYTLSDASSAAS